MHSKRYDVSKLKVSYHDTVLTGPANCMLVGEANPYGSDPRYALYPRPEQSAGGRLCTKVLGLARHNYLKLFYRANLCARKWNLKEARINSLELINRDSIHTYILLGAKVASAFNVPYEPLSLTVYRTPEKSIRLLVIPHPSGLCRDWNDVQSYRRVRGFLRANLVPCGDDDE